MTKSLKIVTLLTILVILIHPAAFGFVCPGDPRCPDDAGIINLPDSPTSNFTATGLLGQIVSSILPAILGIAGFIAVIMIIISGIQFMTSSGNPEAAAAARGRLTFALVGFALIVLSFLILQLVDQLFLGNVVT